MKEDLDKEFSCRQCLTFLDSEELIDRCCPNCESEEDIFINEKEM